jgi:hypothetical protein
MKTQNKISKEPSKKRIFFFVFVIFFSVSCALFAQQSPKIEWQKCYGGTKSEDPSPCRSHSFIQTSDGGYAMAGATISNDGDVSGLHGLQNAWVVKVTASGAVQWQKCLGGSGTDQAFSIIQTTDNGYAIAGWTSSNDGDVSGSHGGVDAWVV